MQIRRRMLFPMTVLLLGMLLLTGCSTQKSNAQTASTAQISQMQEELLRYNRSMQDKVETIEGFALPRALPESAQVTAGYVMELFVPDEGAFAADRISFTERMKWDLRLVGQIRGSLGLIQDGRDYLGYVYDDFGIFNGLDIYTYAQSRVGGSMRLIEQWNLRLDRTIFTKGGGVYMLAYDAGGRQYILPVSACGVFEMPLPVEAFLLEERAKNGGQQERPSTLVNFSYDAAYAYERLLVAEHDASPLENVLCICGLIVIVGATAWIYWRSGRGV